MKILYVLPLLATGGAELQVLKLSKMLPKKNPNIEIHVLSFFEGGDLDEAYRKEGIPTTFLRQGFKPEISRFRFLQSLLRFMRSYKPDVVHTHLTYVNLVGLLAALLCGVPYRVYTVHNKTGKCGRRSAVDHVLSAILSTKIIAVSDAVLKEYKRFLFGRRSKLYRIYNSGSFSARQTGPRPGISAKRRVRIISLGKYSLQKGQMYLLRAMECLAKNEYEFVLDVYGNNYLGEKENLECLRSELGLSNTHLCEHRDRIDEEMDTSDLFVTSSLWEGLGMAVVEAMSMGIPIVATDIPPHRELLGEIPEIHLVPPKNPDAIADEILRLTQNDELYKTISEKEIRISRLFSVDRMVDEYSTLYTRFCRR